MAGWDAIIVPKDFLTVDFSLAKSCLADFMMAMQEGRSSCCRSLNWSPKSPVAVKGKQRSCPCWLWTLGQTGDSLLSVHVTLPCSCIWPSISSKYRTTRTPSFLIIAIMILVSAEYTDRQYPELPKTTLLLKSPELAWMRTLRYVSFGSNLAS